MQAYFSCSITGGRSEQQTYKKIVQHLEEQGWKVPTAHLAEAGILDEESIIDPQTVFKRDVNWVTKSDIMIAEVSTPSHGVGYEIALAEFHQKPVFCCYQSGKKVSKMITGSDYIYQQVYVYEKIEDLLVALDAFLSDFS